ncbi:hypothetical protein HNR62_000318 [Oceanisphaera litoralis]|uniref:hypothetical protein n=1 Tax=Oceanisphaera litoralis TaxID=225144 RepID=UPI00195AB9ED|nr:hypothetical protein [Oceanisphaera litoralis]MBM7454489.1 hypothetical protein [Oceanisphaera litoralis]
MTQPMTTLSTLLASATALELRYVYENKQPSDGSEGYCTAIGSEYLPPHPVTDAEVSEHFWTLYSRDREGYATALVDEADPVKMLVTLQLVRNRHPVLHRTLYNDPGLRGLLDHANAVFLAL